MKWMKKYIKYNRKGKRVEAEIRGESRGICHQYLRTQAAAFWINFLLNTWWDPKMQTGEALARAKQSDADQLVFAA